MPDAARRTRRTIASQALIAEQALPWSKPDSYREDVVRQLGDRIPSTLVDQLWKLADYSGLSLSQVVAMLCHNGLPDSTEEADVMVEEWNKIKIPDARRGRGA